MLEYTTATPLERRMYSRERSSTCHGGSTDKNMSLQMVRETNGLISEHGKVCGEIEMTC